MSCCVTSDSLATARTPEALYVVAYPSQQEPRHRGLAPVAWAHSRPCDGSMGGLQRGARDCRCGAPAGGGRRPPARRAVPGPRSAAPSPHPRSPACVTVAPIMITTSPAAARAVSPGRMRSAYGRISPTAPSTSQTPMKRMNSPGKGDMTDSTSTGVISFIAPAKSKQRCQHSLNDPQRAIPVHHSLLSTLPFHCGFVK